jgi:hypothetical protein
VPVPYKPPNEEVRKKEALDFAARQLFLDPKIGYLNQYIQHISGPIIEQAMKEHEEAKLRATAGKSIRVYLFSEKNWQYDRWISSLDTYATLWTSVEV